MTHQQMQGLPHSVQQKPRDGKRCTEAVRRETSLAQHQYLAGIPQLRGSGLLLDRN